MPPAPTPTPTAPPITPPPPPPITELDALTVRRAVHGQRDATRALVRCYERRVFALVGRMLRPHGLDEAIEDTAQDTFLRVFRHLDRFRPDQGARLSTWILTIATRLCIDRLRRRRGHDTPLDDAPITALGGSLRADQAPIGDGLTQAINSLPPDWHAVFVLRAGHELEYGEIATALAIPVGTVRSRLSRARSRLREILGAEEVDP